MPQNLHAVEKYIQEDDGPLTLSVLVKKSLAAVLCYETAKYCFNTMWKYVCYVGRGKPTHWVNLRLPPKFSYNGLDVLWPHLTHTTTISVQKLVQRVKFGFCGQFIQQQHRAVAIVAAASWTNDIIGKIWRPLKTMKTARAPSRQSPLFQTENKFYWLVRIYSAHDKASQVSI